MDGIDIAGLEVKELQTLDASGDSFGPETFGMKPMTAELNIGPMPVVKGYDIA